jgi:SAM-dependent methyltransferase
MSPTPAPYYRRDLALVHHRGFGFHAAACAPGIIELLAPVRARGGLVLELGCGSGLLTRELIAAGHRVLATDASPAMLELAVEFVDGGAELRRLTLPDDPLPEADAVVAVGHPLNYLRDVDAFDRAVIAIAGAVAPGGAIAFDVCDLEWGRVRQRAQPSARLGEDWAIITSYAVPAPDRFVRDITAFVRSGDGSWRRDDEHHENVLVDVSRTCALLREQGVEARACSSFGAETLPRGLLAVIGTKERAGDGHSQPDP